MKCDEDCNGIKDYTDGVFFYCLCASRVMNSVVGANIRHKNAEAKPMNKQKDAVQEAVEITNQILHDMKDNNLSSVMVSFNSIEFILMGLQTSLESSPVGVDIEELKKIYLSAKGFNSHDEQIIANNKVSGWNDCIDHLQENGYRITR